MQCWGNTFYSQLGYRDTENIGDDETPEDAGALSLGSGVTVTQIVSMENHNCILHSGSVRCWGLNGSGQLGYGQYGNIGIVETPANAGNVNVGATVSQIAVGYAHSCALLDNGRVRCWGANGAGQLGYGHRHAVGDNELPFKAGDVDVGGPVIDLWGQR